MRLRVLGRDDCHLCHDMMADLQVLQRRLSSAHGFEFELIDMDEASGDEGAVWQTYALKIPVLFDEAGNEICFGRLNEAALLRCLSSVN